MPLFLGVDTSNYTTSLSLYSTEGEVFVDLREPLLVGDGEKGLRQSDAVFFHTKNLPVLFHRLRERLKEEKLSIEAIGVSSFPRRVTGSYMPCFLAGEGLANSFGSALNVPVYAFSHQEGHIAAALYSAGRMDVLAGSFLALHASGGTTELVRVKGLSKDTAEMDICLLSASLDIAAGQLIDRVGVMMGLSFPAGAEMDKLAERGKENTVRGGVWKNALKPEGVNLSGFENQARRMLEEGIAKEDCARFIIETLGGLLEALVKREQKNGEPLVLCGGVMENTRLRGQFFKENNCIFAGKGFSCDNATGIAALAAVAKTGKLPGK